jgi:putative ABC transport system substrate-binding protein
MPGKRPRLGLLATTPLVPSRLEAFRDGLRTLGYVEGQTITIEYRETDRFERLQDLAAELIALDVDLILATSGPAAQAASRATTSLPIVMATSANAVEVGLVSSLARPGGNLTGFTVDTAAAVGKALETFRYLLPGPARLGIFWNPDNLAMAPALRANEGVAQKLGWAITPIAVRDARDLDFGFAEVEGSGAEALFVMPGVQGVPGGSLERAIPELALQRRLPSMYAFSEPVRAGGLAAAVTSLEDLYRRSATYVDRILRGAKPADLPVELPTRTDVIVNVRTAHALGVTISQSTLAQVTELIE